MRSRRKTLRHEPLEERQLLAVDSGMAVVSGHVFAEDSSEETAPYAVTILEDTALVEFDDLSIETTVVYGPFLPENYGTPYKPDGLLPEIDSETMEAFRELWLKKKADASSELTESICEGFPEAQPHGQISVLNIEDYDTANDDNIMMLMSSGDSGGGSGGTHWSVTAPNWYSCEDGLIIYNSTTHSGGKIFPEESYPGEAIDMKLAVGFSIVNPSTTDYMVVFLEAVDIPNWKLGGTGNDNYGSVEFADAPTNLAGKNRLVLPANTSSYVGLVTINDAHPGDNWTFRVSYVNASGQTVYSEQSQAITVWRTLWIELDQMAAPDPTNPGHGFFESNWGYQAPESGSGSSGGGPSGGSDGTSEPNDYDVIYRNSNNQNLPIAKPDISLLQTAMLAACIEVKEVSQIPANDSWRVGDTNNQWNTEVGFDRNSPRGMATTFFDKRDVNYNNENFWCIYGVGAYEAGILEDWDWTGLIKPSGPPPQEKEEGILGNASRGDALFTIYQETGRDVSKTGWKERNGVKEYCTRNQSEINRIATFHEVLHFFHFFDVDEENFYDINEDGAIMDTNSWLYSVSASHVETLSSSQVKKIQRLYDYPR